LLPISETLILLIFGITGLAPLWLQQSLKVALERLSSIWQDSGLTMGRLVNVNGFV